MTVNWGEYEIYQPLVTMLHRDMSRQEARLSYSHVMAKKDLRMRALSELTALNGLELDGSPQSTDALGRWIYENVEEDPAQPGRLLSRWYSVVFDTGLCIGDLIITLNPLRHWVMQLGGRTHVAYQKASIAGFRDAKYSIDPDRYVSGIAYDAIAGRPLEASPLWEYVQLKAQDR